METSVRRVKLKQDLSDLVCGSADMDMCSTVEHGCEHQCVSTPGSYYCICPEGRLLQDDGKSCGSKSTDS